LAVWARRGRCEARIWKGDRMIMGSAREGRRFEKGKECAFSSHGFPRVS